MASPRVERRILHALAGGHRVGDLHGTFKDWATELGSTHEVLHRTLRQLERKGVIDRTGKVIQSRGC